MTVFFKYRRLIASLMLISGFVLMSKDDNFGCDNPGWTRVG